MFTIIEIEKLESTKNFVYIRSNRVVVTLNRKEWNKHSVHINSVVKYVSVSPVTILRGVFTPWTIQLVNIFSSTNLSH